MKQQWSVKSSIKINFGVLNVLQVFFPPSEKYLMPCFYLCKFSSQTNLS